MAAVSSSVDTGFQPTEATAQAVSPMTTTSPTDRLRCPARRHPVAQVAVGSQLSSSKMCSSAALMAVCCGRVSVGMGRLKVAAARSRAGAARLKPRKLAGGLVEVHGGGHGGCGGGGGHGVLPFLVVSGAPVSAGER